jgi:hypothetical protein
MWGAQDEVQALSDLLADATELVFCRRTAPLAAGQRRTGTANTVHGTSNVG